MTSAHGRPGHPVAGSTALLVAALLALAGCHSGGTVGQGVAVSSAADSRVGAGGESSPGAAVLGSAPTESSPELPAEEGSTPAAHSPIPSSASETSQPPAGTDAGDTQWDGTWAGAAQEPNTTSPDDTEPVTFTVQGGKVENFVAYLAGTCSTMLDEAFVTDTPIKNGVVDVSQQSENSGPKATSYVHGAFAGSSAFGTVFYTGPNGCDAEQWTWKATRTAGPGAAPGDSTLSSAEVTSNDQPPSSQQVSVTSSQQSATQDGSSGSDDGGAAISGASWTGTVPSGWSIAEHQQGDDTDLSSADGGYISIAVPVAVGESVDQLGPERAATLTASGYTITQQPITDTWAGQPAYLIVASKGGVDAALVGAVFDGSEVDIVLAVPSSISKSSPDQSALQALESTWHWNS